MVSRYAWLLPLLASVSFIWVQRYLKRTDYGPLQDDLSAIGNVHFQQESPGSEPLVVKAEQRVFSPNELRNYITLKDGLYLSILGQVFDVTKGVKHYGPGATYHAFTGRDASLAFITGDFGNERLTDDVSSLSAQQVKALNDWVQFYNKNYVYKGKLNGRYFNEDGSPTKELYNVQQKLIQAEEESSMEEQRKRMFPPCNMEWNPETGSVVWCTKKSGGISRDWTGVPRMFYESPSSKQYRCACVHLDSRAYQEAKGAIREYEGCLAVSTRCAVKGTEAR